ncbi:MAG: protein kinase [Acidobacteria bacterium]|nr:protein kinase [Acidobacteriota bacterium]
MAANEQSITEVAAAILDGTPIDWSAAETGVSEEDRALLEELRLLCGVADVHRQLPPGAEQDGTGRKDHPEFWGRLRVTGRVGSGTFGDVYRAWDPRLDREVALKLIPIKTGSDRRSAEIIREGRLLARVRHPGVVAIYDAEQIESQVGLCMEFVEGPTLQQRLEQKGPFNASETLEIGLQLCDALAAAHDAGVLHRDVKASNVVVKPDGRVVLMDFGAGRRLDGDVTADPTGTPLYLAPEVLVQGLEATIRSDVYSLGVLLYYMLTGSYPVTARSLSELHEAHQQRLKGSPAPRLPRHPDIPARLAASLERAIDPDPTRRYLTVAALGRDLRALHKGPRWRSWPVVVSATALVVAVLVAGGMLLSARTASREPVRIAILPFAITDDQSDSDVIREGTARGLIARMQAYDNARVISTASVLSVDTNLSLKEIGARLGVSAVLTGRIGRSGDVVSAEARLLRVSDERMLWSEEYSRPASEMLDLHRAIAVDLAEELRLGGDERRQQWPTHNLQAHALYVRGQAALDKFTPRDARTALQLFERALELDPDYAQAHAGVARVYLDANAVPNLAGAEALRRATASAARAMSLDQWLPEAHSAAAAVHSTQTNWAAADREYQIAIDLGPGNAVVREHYARWLSLLGRHDEAVAQARVAELLDPLSPRAVMAVASALRFGRRYEEAIGYAHKALDLDRGHPAAYHNLALDYQELGRFDEAIEAYLRLGRPTGNLGHAYAQAGRTREARAVIAQLEERYAKDRLGAGDIAQVYSGLGEIDRAFEWLERWSQTSVGGPITFKVAPVWDPLRSDPRFTTLLKKYGLAD